MGRSLTLCHGRDAATGENLAPRNAVPAFPRFRPTRVNSMIKFLSALLLALVMAACGRQTPNPSPAPAQVPPKNPDAWTGVDQTLDAYLKSAGGVLGGYAFAVFNQSGILHSRYGGDYDRDTRVWLASASKVPSAAAILSLVDAGLLDLDEPISTYVEQAGNPIVWPADKRAITMRMLLAHTSGLSGNGPAQAKCLLNVVTLTLQQCAQLIALAPIVHGPGSAFNYGGADYQLAGYIATLIAGMDWQDFFDEAMAHPLALDSFSYGDPEQVRNPRIAGGASANLEDYARIMQMLQNAGEWNGVRVLSQAAVEMLQTNQIAGTPVVYEPFPSGDQDRFDGYTLGFWISASDQHPGSPGPEFSDPGLFGSTAWIDAGLGYGAVILIERSMETGLEMWSAVRPLLISQLR
jgi:CubicO group peptidase (beta-lactamase class C family)